MSFPEIRKDGFNLVRVQLFWADYLANESGYLADIKNLAQIAEEDGLSVDFVMMEYNTGPQYGGFGFPLSVTQGYAYQEAFWTQGWYPNAVVVDGVSGWDYQLQTWRSILGAVDRYSSVIGYEILNEPPIWTHNQFSQLGTLQSYLASHIRQMTSKWILFSRPYLSPGSNLSANGQPTLQEMLLAAPSSVKELVFAPHRYGFYSAQGCSTCTDGNFLNYSKVSKALNVPVFLGEWSIVNHRDTSWNQNETNFLNGYIGYMRHYGFAWAYNGWQEGAIFNVNDSDEWQYQLDRSGNQWALDVGLSSAIARFYPVTVVLLTTVTVSTVSSSVVISRGESNNSGN